DSVTCWVAPRDVVPGADWGESIINAIESSRIMILIFSKNANESSQIKREVERAVNKEVYIIPFRIDDVAPAKKLEYFISTSQWMDAFSPPLERHLSNLAKTVKSVLANPPLPKPLDIEAPVNPPLPDPVDIEAPVTPVGRTRPVADGSTPHISSRLRMAIIATIPTLVILGAAGWYLGHKREVPPEKLSEPTQAAKRAAAAKPAEDEADKKQNIENMRAAMLGAVAKNLKDGASSPSARLNHVAIRPLKRTYIKVIVDNENANPAFERWISPADGTVEFRGQHISVRVLDRDAVQITKNGNTLEESDDDVTVD